LRNPLTRFGLTPALLSPARLDRTTG